MSSSSGSAGAAAAAAAGAAAAAAAGAAAGAASKPSALAVAGWIFGSVFSSVALILVNKVIVNPDPIKGYNFGFIFTLTSLHFFVTALGMEVMAMLGMFTRLRLPLFDTAVMAAMCIGSVAFMNFSLQLNSVGFYQITKLLCIPCMVAVQQLFYRQTFTLKIKLVLFVVLAGVGIATITDLQVNARGMIMGALAVLFTTQFQIWQGDKQKTFGLNAMQMNHAQALPTALLCALIAYYFEFGNYDPLTSVTFHVYQPNELSWIFASCVLALSVNLCTYGLIGKTSPVTFQVVGHAKTCFILLFGYIFFPVPNMTSMDLMKNLAGIFVAMAGVVLYSNVKLADGQSPRPKDWCDTYAPASLQECMNPPVSPETSGYQGVKQADDSRA